MSRKATYLDSAAMESFFHIMKAEVMDEDFDTKESLIQAMTEWINFYNHRRIKIKLNGQSPVKYRKLAVQQAV
ncbi:IS3 family transposase [Loigolactobacillus coryniformis]|jgi:putative transposase|nr:IS3 family transposase [Loigolactobacillus coryniformis]OEH89391.1 transposase [Loigolactobacillus coryniformis subsp. coryniformis]ATO56355.1 transposase [Loigolactobacillus coryniformis subsp. coryniformis KCTC 3167 = DSM 20001]MBW4803321.1 IS3 family transposase [Loigolactobacillus coryniformis subsp. torquens]MBW4806015.1 IS3 family transposase [Loigolactobacillus coryniformis subsp. torquens]MCL5459210.1 IS3 family transposase [Loigolactobacillus coryniformis]